jgi:hypothetical protein
MTAELFWEPDDSPPPPATAADISAWEAEYGVRMPDVLARALLTQNGGLVRGSTLAVEALEAFAALDDEQWDGVWSDGPLADADRGRQIYIGESVGVGVVLDYTAGEVPRVLLLHHATGRELRDHGIGSFEELLKVARLAETDTGAEAAPTPSPMPQSSLWVTTVGPNFAKVFGVIRQVMGVSPSEAKALLSGPPFRVAVGWRSDLLSWRAKLQEAGAAVELRCG